MKQLALIVLCCYVVKAQPSPRMESGVEVSVRLLPTSNHRQQTHKCDRYDAGSYGTDVCTNLWTGGESINTQRWRVLLTHIDGGFS